MFLGFLPKRNKNLYQLHVFFANRRTQPRNTKVRPSQLAFSMHTVNQHR